MASAFTSLQCSGQIICVSREQPGPKGSVKTLKSWLWARGSTGLWAWTLCWQSWLFGRVSWASRMWVRSGEKGLTESLGKSPLSSSSLKDIVISFYSPSLHAPPQPCPTTPWAQGPWSFCIQMDPRSKHSTQTFVVE